MVPGSAFGINKLITLRYSYVDIYDIDINTATYNDSKIIKLLDILVKFLDK